jgi:cyclic beta-1,2-glucan synthetase
MRAKPWASCPPLNRPRFDESAGRVTEGYGILQPRVSVTMSSASGLRSPASTPAIPAFDPHTTAVLDGQTC